MNSPLSNESNNKEAVVRQVSSPVWSEGRRWRMAFTINLNRSAHQTRPKRSPLKKLTIFGITLTLLLGLALWQQQIFVAKAAPVFNTTTVINTNDSGAGSLRQAIASAVNGDTITFDTSGEFAAPQTITLSSGELVVNKSLTIDGPGASQLTVSGNNASRVFFMSSATVLLDGLTVSGGNGTGAVDSGNGGGSSLTYDATSNRYSYTWKTEKAWKGTCRVLVIRLSDGTDHFAKFRFR